MSAYSPVCFCTTPDPILITSHTKDITIAKSRRCIWAAGKRPLQCQAADICKDCRGVRFKIQFHKWGTGRGKGKPRQRRAERLDGDDGLTGRDECGGNRREEGQERKSSPPLSCFTLKTQGEEEIGGHKRQKDEHRRVRETGGEESREPRLLPQTGSLEGKHTI